MKSGIGGAVMTLAVKHPKKMVSERASRLIRTWKKMIEAQVFKMEEGYDADAAIEAPEGSPLAPEVFIQADKEKKRMEKLLRKRQRIEEDVLCSSSSSSSSSDGSTGGGDGADSDEEWCPGPGWTKSRAKESQDCPVVDVAVPTEQKKFRTKSFDLMFSRGRQKTDSSPSPGEEQGVIVL